ncbi:MAG: helix-turn-helix transcriptional regulator [Opitutaceae bacterium]|nr:helix-turn-helix transcriptional regulator [Opitutaceae bacterium]
MNESIAHIAQQIKEAREAKGLSQRALSKKVGIPQSHISKIENGTVNLQLSSLIELARVLELELMLVPKKAQKAAGVIVNDTKRTNRISTAYKTAAQIEQACQSGSSNQILSTIKDLEKFIKQINNDGAAQKIIADALNLNSFAHNMQENSVIKKQLQTLINFRNQFVHSPMTNNLAKYQLDDED